MSRDPGLAQAPIVVNSGQSDEQETRVTADWHSVITWPRVSANAKAIAHFAGVQGRTLRHDFLAAVERLQPIRLDRHGESDITVKDFDPPESNLGALRHVLVVDSLPPRWRYPSDERHAVERRVDDALDLLASVAPKICSAMNTIVGTFLMARLEGYEGGSRSSVIGAIWLGLAPSQSAMEYAELILHEYVHQCLFIEDMVRGLFVAGEADLGKPDALVTSALRRTPRGYDKSFHSALVAATLSRFYSVVDRSEHARRLREPLLITVSELLGKDQYLTPNGRMLLAELAQLVTQE